MKHGTHKNPHAVALGKLGGLVRSDAKRQANRENGRKGSFGTVARAASSGPHRFNCNCPSR
jgi:hypothetical protein